MTTVETPLGVRLPDLVPHWPHPPQEAFLWLDQLEVFYGGAAGGGKSDALLMAALQYVDVPGYAALLLRKSYADLALPGAIMDRSKAWLAGTAARWNDNAKQWTFPSGATITFGYLQTSNDRYRYQGAEFQLIAFDELTQFDEADYAYLLSRLRRPADGPLSRVPLRMRAASNPGGRGHRWVKRRFIDREPNDEDPEDSIERCEARVFVPAKLDDNPSVDQDAYTQALAGLDPQTRAQLLGGDWNARQPGNYVFDGIDAAEQLGAKLDQQRERGSIPPPTDDRILAGVDWGDFRTHAIIGWELERGGLYIPPGEVQSTQADVEDIAVSILNAAGRYDGWWFGEERYDASFAQSNRTFARTAEAKLGPHNPVRKTGRPNTVPIPFAKYKSLAIGYLRFLLRRTAAGETTRVLAISPRNTVLLEQLRGYQQDPETGKPLKGDDDAVDSLIALVAPIARRHRDLTDIETA